MRTSLTLLALGVCLVLWFIGLWLGRPWPVTLALQLLQSGAGTTMEHGPVPDATPAHRLALAPRAGAAVVQRALPCGATHLTVQVTQPLGTRRGLDALAVGWPEREDGWGVLAPNAPEAILTLAGRGLTPASTLQLTSLGGLFDGTGTVEVTPVCAD